jgi:hypothetical protein
MLAYVFWHRPAGGVHEDEYERTLARFHHSLAQNPPAGFCSSVTLRAPELPWLEEIDPGGAPVAGNRGVGYEDWYLVENWTALGVLEAAAVSRGHAGTHERAAREMGTGAAGVYRQMEGAGSPAEARLAVWVSRPHGSPDPTIAELLEDGFDPSRSSLWQRSLVLGPAPELCLLSADEEAAAETGVAGSRLPAGWRALAGAREPLVA